MIETGTVIPIPVEVPYLKFPKNYSEESVQVALDWMQKVSSKEWRVHSIIECSNVIIFKCEDYPDLILLPGFVVLYHANSVIPFTMTQDLDYESGYYILKRDQPETISPEKSPDIPPKET